MSTLVLNRPRPLGDTLALTRRNLRHAVRHVDNLVITLALPVFLMLLFVYCFGGALQGSGAGVYVNYVVPGVMILVAGYAAASVAAQVATDVQAGLVDRLRSMPVHAGGLLTGHVLATVLLNATSMAAVLGVAFLEGYAPVASAGQWLLALALVVLYTVALTWVGVAMGLAVSGPEAASGMTFVLLFLPYVSSAFVPVATLPGWLQGFAQHMPITPVTDSVRSLLTGQHPDRLWIGLAWCLGILLAGRAGALLSWRRKA
jgi:ABC-2 type transport system permease protein